MEDWFNEDGTRKDSKLTTDYTAMGHSQDLIDSIVTGKKSEEIKDSEGKVSQEARLMVMHDATDAEKKARVNNNVGYLEYMRAKTDWKGDEDWTAIDKAITDGKAYVG